MIGGVAVGGGCSLAGSVEAGGSVPKVQRLAVRGRHGDGVDGRRRPAQRDLVDRHVRQITSQTPPYFGSRLLIAIRLFVKKTLDT